MPTKMRKAILLFGIVNAALFSALLPLWEGFDEPFHYGYVETLWQTGRLPVLGRTLIPNDVFASFSLAPASFAVHGWVPESTTYHDWFALPAAEKERRRQALALLRPEPHNSSRPNYEAHQAPLAYLLLAPLDWSMARFSLPVRVLVLRLVAALASVGLLYYGTAALCRAMEMPEAFTPAVLFTVFCSEMLYATTAHVANDWLSVGVSAPFFAWLAIFVKRPDRRSFFGMTVWLTAGLLAKAYFLAFLLATAGVTIMLFWRRRIRAAAAIPGVVLILALAGPWYARNVALYGNIPGTHEAFDGVTMRQALAAASRIDWPAAAGFLARGSLWMANNSFGTYSRGTLNAMLGLLALGGIAWCSRRRAIQPSENAIVAAILTFSAAVAYASCVAFVDRHGTVAAAPPWYTQVLLAPVLAVVYLGLSRWKRVGAALAGVSVALWAWVLLATWTVKLFPLYSGGGSAAMRAKDVWNWYGHDAAAHARDLSLTALAPAAWLYAGLLVSAALTVALVVLLVRRLAKAASG